MSLHYPAAIAHTREDVQLMILDILYLGKTITQLPYTARRDLLDDLGLPGPGIAVPPVWPAMAAEALEHTRREGYDGFIAKRLTSPYLPGRRSRDGSRSKTFPQPIESPADRDRQSPKAIALTTPLDR
ncbi:hypothetical protein ACIRD2_33990 [Streptomyces sp. NPDC093595]|uniref:ATP-dependent DNA ligase n=1 Tax=Streptomyces sp. NPDC093595 TaxID=3366045 RepID=UPI00382721B7